MKTILLILALSGSLSAEVGVSLYTNGISQSSADTRYVLRNPYYDGSQSVTVASASVNGAMDVTGILRIAPPYYLKSDELVSYTGGATGITIPSVVKVPNGSFSVGTSTLVVTGGKVGVGTASPSVKLHIQDTGAVGGTGAGSFRITNSALTKGLSAGYDTTSNYGYLFTAEYGSGYLPLNLQPLGGNVGIGTTAPTSALSIAQQGWNDGYARGVYAYNRAGATISSGTVVVNNPFAGSSTVDVTTAPANVEWPVGTVYDTAGCADDSLCRICTEGLCLGRLDSDDDCAVTDFVVVTGDEVGRIGCNPDTSAEHNQELGQPQEYTTQLGHVIKFWAHRN